MYPVTAVLAALLLISACQKAPTAPAPRQIHLVGSIAAYPFSVAVAERFMREETEAVAPLAQADGTGSGIVRFCAGLGSTHPDLIGAARAMTAAERAGCAKNGIGDIAEIPFGWSALVFVTRPDTPALAPTRADLQQALSGAASGAANDWHAIDPALPALRIALHGPTPSPALADGLFGPILAPDAVVRTDGLYRPHGADADAVIRAVLETPGTIGLVPWAYAVKHGDTLRLLPIDGVTPDAATIASGRYPARLPLILYAKPAEVASVPGLPKLLADYAEGWGQGGAFAGAGLIPLTPAAQAEAGRQITAIARR